MKPPFVVIFGAAIALAVAVLECTTPPRPLAPTCTGVVDVVDAVCAPATATPPAGYLLFDCTLPDAGADTVASFTTKIPADEAPTFAMHHARKAKP